MLLIISTNEEYNNSLKRIQEIVNYLNDNSKTTMLPELTFIQIFQHYKMYINSDNPLQILISEGIYLSQLINNYLINN